MKRKKFFKTAVFLSVAFGLYTGVFRLAEAAEPLELIYGMKDAYSQVEDYQVTFIRQERTEKKLNEPEEIELEFKRPFMVKMRWTKGPKKGRQAVYVEGANNNLMKVRMEGLLGRFIKILTLDPEGLMARRGSRHSIRQAGLGNLIDSLIRVTQAAEAAGDLKVSLLGEEVVGGRAAYEIERILPAGKYESPRTLIFIDKEMRLPVGVVRFNEQGELFERYTYSNLRINQDLSRTEFKLEDRFKRNAEEDAVILAAVHRQIQEAVKVYVDLKDYMARFYKRERIGDELLPEEIYEIQFMKPFSLSLKNLQGRFEGTVITYSSSRAKGEKMYVHPGGVVGNILSTVNFDEIPVVINSFIATKGNRHLISEFGIGYFLERYQKDFENSLREKDFYVDTLLWKLGEDAGIQIELILKDLKKLSRYYAYRTLVFFSNTSGLPTEIKVFDSQNNLLEYYRYGDLRVNVGLTKEDFVFKKASPVLPEKK